MKENITTVTNFELYKYQYLCGVLTRIYRLAAHNTRLFYSISTTKIQTKFDDFKFQIKLNKNYSYSFIKYYFCTECGDNCLSLRIEIDEDDKNWNNQLYKDLPQKIYEYLIELYKGNEDIEIKTYNNYKNIHLYIDKKNYTQEFYEGIELLEKEYNIKNIKLLQEKYKITIQKFNKEYLEIINEVIQTLCKQH